SPDFPATPGAYDTSYDDWSDAFVTKLSPTGNALIYSTFLGGSHGDVGNAIAVDASGYAYITGGTGSTDFPTTPSAYDQSFSGVDAFVTKLSPTGNALIYSTFLGGGNGERAQAIAIDASGCAYITGWTESLNFPTTPGAYDLSHSGGPSYGPYDAFVTKLSPTGNALIYSTFLGGIQADVGNAIAVDA
ncbi:MAG: SBBP repeat-containing protein, partial [Bacteroidia bacterium]|nr:SBBP repeat-containing protein [Bacteroidia bacterium]